MRSQALEILKQKQQSTGGHCGVRLADFNIPIPQLKKLLNQLYKEGLIEVRDGAGGELVKLA